MQSRLYAPFWMIYLVLFIVLLQLSWTNGMASGNAGSAKSRSERPTDQLQCDPDMKRILDSVSLSHLSEKFAAEKVHTHSVLILLPSYTHI